MIEPEYLFVFVGSVQVIFFFFSMFSQASYVEGTSLTTVSLRYQDSRLIFYISLDRIVIWRAVKTSTPWFVSCSWFYFIGAFSPVAFQYIWVDLQACAYSHPLIRSSS
jgi:hypothetical protein